MPRKRVYLAGPVSQGDRLHNLHQALTAFRMLLQRGYAPLCPHLTMLADFVLAPIDYESYLQQCLAWVSVAEHVVRLPGESPGADRETALARARGIPVHDGMGGFLEAVDAK